MRTLLRRLGWDRYEVIWSRPDGRPGHDGLRHFDLDYVWARSAKAAVRRSRRRHPAHRIEEVAPRI